MIEFAFIGAMLAAYPLENLSNVPNSVQVAQHFENINPYECVRIIDYNLPLLEQKSQNTNSIKEKSDSARDIIFALLAKQSCQITANDLDGASNTTNIISQYKLDKTNFAVEKFIFNYNLNRLKLQQFSKNEFIDFYKNLNIPSDSFNYIKIQELTWLNLSKEYLQAAINYNAISKQSNNDTLPANLQAALYFNGYISKQIDLNFNDSLELLDKAVDALNSENYSYTQAIIASQAAKVYADLNMYDKAIYYQEIFLKVIEKIPEKINEYIIGIEILSELYSNNRNVDQSYMLLIKADNLLNIVSHPIDEMCNVRLKIGLHYLNLNNTQKAISTLKTANSDYKVINNNEGFINSTLALANAYITAGQVTNAKNTLSSISNEQLSQLSNTQKFQLALNSARIEAKRNNYKEAFNQLLNILNNKQIDTETPTNNKQKNYMYSQLLPKHNVVVESKIASHDNNDSFFTISWSLLLVLILFMQLIIIRLNNNNKQLRHKLEDEIENRRYTTEINLSNEQDFLNFLLDLGADFKNNNIKTIPSLIIHEKEIYHLYIPALSNLNINVGNAHANQIFNIFRDKIKSFNSTTSRIFELANDRFIIIRDVQSEITTETACNYYFEMFGKFLNELRLQTRICIGTIDYPFLTKTPYELDSRKILELTLIALSGSISLSTKDNTWLRLTAITISKNFLISGDIRQCVLDGIRKNLIKIMSSHDKSIINWNYLIERNIY